MLLRTDVERTSFYLEQKLHSCRINILKDCREPFEGSMIDFSPNFPISPLIVLSCNKGHRIIPVRRDENRPGDIDL